MATLNSKEIKERSKAKGDDGEGLYVRGRTDRRDSRQSRGKSRSKSRGGRLECYICQSEDHLKRNCPKNNSKKSTGYVKKDEQPSSSGSTYDVTSKVVLYRNMGFNESGEYKKTFIGSGVGTGLMQVLQGDEVESEPQDGHTFEVKPHRNVGHVVGSQEYREDSNEAAFAVATVDKIYAHESLTFNDTVACEVISKWKAGLKDDMDARSDVYVLSNGCKKCNDNSDGNYWESTPGDRDVEKNGKWSCIYAVGSQEYQMVCTRLDIASADVGMLDKFEHGLQTDAVKEAIWLKRLAIESGYKLSLVAGIATCALVKGGSQSKVPAQVNIDASNEFVVEATACNQWNERIRLQVWDTAVIYMYEAEKCLVVKTRQEDYIICNAPSPGDPTKSSDHLM
ncbi:zinc finger, CCHC-type containing protein [Tanacetum coccineum]